MDKSITWIAGSTVQLNLKYSNISMQNYWFIRLRQRTVSECPCYRWPRICSPKNRFRMSVLQITTNIFVKEPLQNVRVTDDHEYVPFAIVIIHSYSPLHDWSPNMTYHRNANTKNTTVVTIRAGFAYLSWAPPVFRGVHVA